MPHSAFEGYILQIAPRAGLSWIKATSKKVETGSYGQQLKSAFDTMEQKLAATYGRQKKHDFLMHESIWSEPRDWMQSLLSKERVLLAEWSKETGASLTDSLSSVALVIDAYDTSSGFFAIEYYFENSVLADAEIAALEDDAL